MNSDILNDKVFDCLDDNMKRAFISLNENMKNKSYDEKLAMIIAFVQSMPKGVSLTKEEKEAMINVLMVNMNENEKRQFKMIRLLMGF